MERTRCIGTEIECVEQRPNTLCWEPDENDNRSVKAASLKQPPVDRPTEVIFVGS